MTVLGPVLIDGAAVDPDEAMVSVFDIGLLRGYGCFETVRSYAGRPFRLDWHLDRLEASAAIMGIPLPDRAILGSWIRDRAAEGDCSVRVVVTGGTDATRPGVGSRVIVTADSLGHIAAEMRLQPRPAPWHADGAPSELTGAKTLSYGPNLAARLAAVADGFDDALLIGESGSVLEGPTYSIGWVREGRLEYPGPELMVLPGVTVATVSEVAPRVGLEPAPGRYDLDRLLGADEVVAMSTLREVRPVVAVGARRLTAGPFAGRLSAEFLELVEDELSGRGADTR